MKITIDLAAKTLETQEGEETRTLDLYSDPAFELLSDMWVKVGWNQKYVYTFSWMGRPVIQLPEDMIRIQEIIHRVQPDVIIETGVAHGGSLVFYASLFKALGRGRVIGVDIEIRPHNREAIEAHALFPYITLIEGSSTDSTIVRQVEGHVKPGETVLVILDSNHTKKHVQDELAAYHHLVTPGSYIVATDGVMMNVWDVPRGTPGWKDDNPTAAAAEFVQTHPEFVIENPAWPFNESTLTAPVTHWPGAWLRRQ